MRRPSYVRWKRGKHEASRVVGCIALGIFHAEERLALLHGQSFALCDRAAVDVSFHAVRVFIEVAASVSP